MTDDTINLQDIEIVRDSCLRHGMSTEDAEEVIQTCMLEWSKGDARLLDLFLEKALH